MKTQRIYAAIPASEYAAWIAKNKPKNINQRRLKKTKRKLFKVFCRKTGLTGRVKTHDHNHPSFILWRQFNEEFFAVKNKIMEHA